MDNEMNTRSQLTGRGIRAMFNMLRDLQVRGGPEPRPESWPARVEADGEWVPNLHAEDYVIKTWGLVLNAHGVTNSELLELVVGYTSDAANCRPGWGINFPAPADLLRYRVVTRVPAITETTLVWVIRELVNHAQHTTGLPRQYMPQGVSSWAEAFDARVKRYIGDLSPAVAAGLEAVGGRLGLVEAAQSEFTASRMRQAFRVAVREAEAKGQPGQMAQVLQLDRAPREVFDADASVEVHPSVAPRLRAIRERMLALPAPDDTPDIGEVEERRRELRAQRVILESREG